MAYDGPRVMGVLNMTRAVGDHSLRPFVIAAAEVWKISNNDYSRMS